MIKFRAWDKKTERMWDIETWHIADEYVDLIEPGKSIADISAERFWRKQSEIILMQSTGLKDKNGVDIFEGDVVWIIDKGEMDNGWGWFEEVKLRNGSFMVDDDFIINSHHRCVVRGNIYEQPELLGGQA